MMKQLSKVIPILAVLFSIGSAANSNEAYLPSLGELKANETLIMNVLQCHRGCSTATVAFSDGYASLIPHELELTSEEILDLERIFRKSINFTTDATSLGRRLKLTEKEISVLDNYFQNPESNCSHIIKISFVHKRGHKVLNSKKLETYPCTEGGISLRRLIWYFEDYERIKIPFWRLSPEEYDNWQQNLYGPK